MEFILTQNEMSYIQNEFNYKHLHGVASCMCNKRQAENSLLNRKMIYPVKDCFELCNELRLLFATWLNVKFVMSRPDLHSSSFDICLLSDEKCIIYFKREKSQYNIRFVDMDSSIMDFYMCSCMQLWKADDISESFNVKVPMEILDMIIKDGSTDAMTKVSKQTGLPVEWLVDYRANIMNASFSPEAYAVVLTEDLSDNVGCLTKIVNTEKSLYAFKHITRPNGEQVALIRGGTDFLVSCMYNF